mmetsp:Transcript_56437/g.155982  ORF Transcript_56437/g.155982 Transcript_56437/m.155982 type:complete len:204 (-) Transcript_56437:1187-1798(-)
MTMLSFVAIALPVPTALLDRPHVLRARWASFRVEGRPSVSVVCRGWSPRKKEVPNAHRASPAPTPTERTTTVPLLSVSVVVRANTRRRAKPLASHARLEKSPIATEPRAPRATRKRALQAWRGPQTAVFVSRISTGTRANQTAANAPQARYATTRALSSRRWCWKKGITAARLKAARCTSVILKKPALGGTKATDGTDRKPDE